jgi:hypothetical protein
MDRHKTPVVLFAALLALATQATPTGAEGYRGRSGEVVTGHPERHSRGLDRPGLGEPAGPSFEALPPVRGQGWFPSAGRPPARGRYEYDDGAPAAPAEPFERSWTSFPNPPPAATPYADGVPIDFGVIVAPPRRR